jgi:hypothetical protein
MPNTLTANPPKAPAPAGNQAAAVVVERRRFATATYPHSEQTTVTHALTGAAQTPQPVDLPAFGYLRAVWIEADVVAVNVAADVAAAADAPWSLFDQIELQDVSSQPLVQLTGYHAYAMHKYGGYGNSEDPTLDGYFSAPIEGVEVDGGSTRFALRIPVEIVARDAFGSLLNQSQQQPFRVRYTLAANTSLYDTIPDGAVTVNLTITPEMWAIPPESIGGVQNQTAPDAHGTTQYWTQHQQAIAAAGQQVVRLPRVGGMLRNIIYIFRDGAGARVDAGFPAVYEFRWEGRPLLNESRTQLQRRIRRAYGPVAVSAADVGVFVFPFMTDEMDGKPGGELRDHYLPTNGASRIELSGVFPVGSVDTLVNDVYSGRRS